MSKVVFMIMLALILGLTSASFALSPEESKTIQAAAEKFLDSTPDNNFLLQPDEINKRIKSGVKDFLLVDVRSTKEFNVGHIPGAISIPYLDIVDPKNLALLPKDKEIILYCNSGHESTKVLSILRMLGYNVNGMKWGMMGWNIVPSTGAALKAIAAGTSGTFPMESSSSSFKNQHLN